MWRGDVGICCHLSHSCLFFGAVGQSRGGCWGCIGSNRENEWALPNSVWLSKKEQPHGASSTEAPLPLPHMPSNPLKWPPTPPLFALLSSSLTHWTCPRFCMYLHRHASSSPSTAPVTQPDWSYLHLRSLALYTSFLLRLCLKWIFSSLTENVWILQNLILFFTLLLVFFL